MAPIGNASPEAVIVFGLILLGACVWIVMRGDDE